MGYKKVPIGEDPPKKVYAIIENSVGAQPVKYEIDKKSNIPFVDRFLHTAMHYPGNYGFVPHTLSEDGDPIDVLVVGETPIIPGAAISVVPIGVLIMEDEAGMDEKIIAVPAKEVSSYYADIKNYDDLPQMLLDKIEHFFKHYKDLEKGKWVKTVRWGDAEEAQKLINEAIEREEKRVKPSSGPAPS